MQSLAVRLGLAGITAGALIAVIPSGGAHAAEPLPSGTYEVVVPAGAVSFEVFYDGAVRVLTSAEGLEVTFRFDDDVHVLDEFTVSSPEGAFEVDIDVDEAGGYRYDVEALPADQAPPADVAPVAGEGEGDDGSGGGADGQATSTSSDDELAPGRPTDRPAPPACDIAAGRAPEKNPNCVGAENATESSTRDGGGSDGGIDDESDDEADREADDDDDESDDDADDANEGSKGSGERPGPGKDRVSGPSGRR